MKSILGIGNALTDILAVLPDDTLLKTFHLPLGSMQHVDRETGDMLPEAPPPIPSRVRQCSECLPDSSER